jgi:hypothetical protein
MQRAEFRGGLAAILANVGSLMFRGVYRLLRLLDPVMRGAYRTMGLGNVLELRVRSRSRGQERSVLLGLLRTEHGLYLGHPNGWARWTRDLQAAGRGALVWRDSEPISFRPVLLSDGPEREAVIRATWTQHPFPGNLIYSLLRRHVRRHGVYFRLEPA